jgi:phosphoribosyl-ATP pyrophosphohydrolase
MGQNTTSGVEVLDRLAQAIEGRRHASPEHSHTAKLLSRGTKRIAQKVGEEAVETVIEAVRGRRDKLIQESADLMYHLLVLWADARILPAEIWAELARREGVSGIEEKAARDDDGWRE